MKTNYEETLALLRKAVVVRGSDYTYPVEWKDGAGMCMYVAPDGTTPGCIVGFVAAASGIDVDQLKVHEGSSADTVGWALGFDDAATRLLYHVQCFQDEGHTWGEAVEFAIQTHEEQYSERSTT